MSLEVTLKQDGAALGEKCCKTSVKSGEWRIWACAQHTPLRGSGSPIPGGPSGRGGTRGAAAPAPTRPHKAAARPRACALRCSPCSQGQDGGVLGYVARGLGPEGASRLCPPAPGLPGEAPRAALPAWPAVGCGWHVSGWRVRGLSLCPQASLGCEKWLSEWFCRFYWICGFNKGAS